MSKTEKKTKKTDWLDLANECIDRWFRIHGEEVDARFGWILDLKYSKVKVENLLAEPDGDFCHDMVGIDKHMDRQNFCLTRCFVPRAGLMEEQATR